MGAFKLNALPFGEVPGLTQWALIGLAVVLAVFAYRKIGYRRTLWQQ